MRGPRFRVASCRKTQLARTGASLMPQLRGVQRALANGSPVWYTEDKKHCSLRAARSRHDSKQTPQGRIHRRPHLDASPSPPALTTSAAPTQRPPFRMRSMTRHGGRRDRVFLCRPLPLQRIAGDYRLAKCGLKEASQGIPTTALQICQQFAVMEEESAENVRNTQHDLPAVEGLEHVRTKPFALRQGRKHPWAPPEG